MKCLSHLQISLGRHYLEKFSVGMVIPVHSQFKDTVWTSSNNFLWYLLRNSRGIVISQKSMFLYFSKTSICYHQFVYPYSLPSGIWLSQKRQIWISQITSYVDHQREKLHDKMTLQCCTSMKLVTLLWIKTQICICFTSVFVRLLSGVISGILGFIAC